MVAQPGGGRMRWLPAAVALGCVGLSFFLTRLLAAYGYDQPLLLPIIREAAAPGTYPPSDLLVASGREGPFHVYHAAGLLYRLVGDFGTAWFATYVLFLFAYLLACWRVAMVVSPNRWVATLTLVALALMNPQRGALNWSWAPPPSMLSSTAALPFVMMGFAWLLEGRFVRAAWMVLFAFTAHPGHGSVLAACVAGTVLLDAGVDWKSRARVWGVCALGALPNTLFLLTRVRANFVGAEGASNATRDFFHIFDLMSVHAYVGPHWPDGYGFFALLVAMAVWGAAQLTPPVRRRLGAVAGVCAALLTVYVLNLYVVRYPGLVLTFLFRVTIPLKPMGLAVVAAALLPALSRVGPQPERVQHARAAAVVVLMVSAALLPRTTLSEMCMLGALGLLLADGARLHVLMGAGLMTLAGGEYAALTWRTWVELKQLPPEAPWAAAVAASRADQAWGGTFTGLNVVAGALAAAVCAFAPVAAPDAPTNARLHRRPWLAALAFLTGLGIYATTPGLAGTGMAGVRDAVNVTAPDPLIAGVVRWFERNTSSSALVLLPVHPRFLNFRAAAARGVYVTGPEILQLSYDLPRYFEAFERLKRAGVTVPRRYVMEDQGYSQLTAADLQRMRVREGVTHAVFELGARGPALMSLGCTAQVDGYCIVDVSTCCTDPGQRTVVPESP